MIQFKLPAAWVLAWTECSSCTCLSAKALCELLPDDASCDRGTCGGSNAQGDCHLLHWQPLNTRQLYMLQTLQSLYRMPWRTVVQNNLFMLQALQAWYRDALAGIAPMHPSTAAAAGLDLMSSPLGRLQLQSPDRHTQGGATTGTACEGIIQGSRQQPVDIDSQNRELQSSHRGAQGAPATNTAAGSRRRGPRQPHAGTEPQNREAQVDAESAAAADGVLSPLERLRLQTPATARVRPPTRALTIGEVGCLHDLTCMAHEPDALCAWLV